MPTLSDNRRKKIQVRQRKTTIAKKERNARAASK